MSGNKVGGQWCGVSGVGSVVWGQWCGVSGVGSVVWGQWCGVSGVGSAVWGVSGVGSHKFEGTLICTLL